jgi:predicted transcriptional regulator
MTNLHDIATVTAAYLRHNRIAPGELSALISQIARTYQGLDGIPEAVAEKPQPVVSIRSSVKPDALTCLECGRTLKTLRKHIRDHGLEPDSYRERFGLAASYPMVAPAYAAQRSAMAKQFGLGRSRVVGESTPPSEPASDPEPEPAPEPPRVDSRPLVPTDLGDLPDISVIKTRATPAPMFTDDLDQREYPDDAEPTTPATTKPKRVSRGVRR